MKSIYLVIPNAVEGTIAYRTFYVFKLKEYRFSTKQHLFNYLPYVVLLLLSCSFCLDTKRTKKVKSTKTR